MSAPRNGSRFRMWRMRTPAQTQSQLIAELLADLRASLGDGR